MHASRLLLEYATSKYIIFHRKAAEGTPEIADTKGKGGLVCFVGPSLQQLGQLPCTYCLSNRDFLQLL